MKLINHIGLSSGKDSTALLGWAIHESGYPRESIRCSFADTENEYDEVYEQIGLLNDYCRAHGVAPIRTLRSEGFLNLAIRKKRFPGPKSRFCTEVLKILPMIYYIQEMWLDGWEVVLHSGVRRDESTERSVMEPVSFSFGCKVLRPMLDKNLADVWAMHDRYGLPRNKLYLTGRKRVGCRLCCMSNKDDVRLTARTQPWVIDLYRGWERVVGVVAGNPSGVATFFPARTASQQFRSIGGLVRKKDTSKGKKGEVYSVATIDDVVAWSKTLHGGKQEGFEFMYEQDDTHAPCNAGYCE